jgi:hypothetical protein
MKLSLHEVAQVVGAKNDITVFEDTKINKIEFDSRLIEEGDLVVEVIRKQAQDVCPLLCSEVSPFQLHLRNIVPDNTADDPSLHVSTAIHDGAGDPAIFAGFGQSHPGDRYKCRHDAPPPKKWRSGAL